MDNIYSNIVTPPDFPTEAFHSVLLIDAIPDELETLAYFLKTSDVPFNVFVYRTGMNDQKWLEKALKKANAVIINTVQTEDSIIKDKLVIDESAYYYGPKNFLMNKKHIQKPIDYFISHINITGETETHVVQQ